MAEHQMTLVDRREIAKGTMAFWFQTNGAKYEFLAGQHAGFAFMHPSEGDEADNLRTFSLASDPHDQGLVMIAMRMRGDRLQNCFEDSSSWHHVRGEPSARIVHLA